MPKKKAAASATRAATANKRNPAAANANFATEFASETSAPAARKKNKRKAASAANKKR